ncbi:MAG: right-handed parallel beta-helix repeat-containing protein [Candidatus Poribacteria bacterium]
MSDKITITVGQEKADIVGSDNRAIQSAIDYVAGLGGGTVIILAGTYLMKDSLHLRSNITLMGQGDKTVLRKSNGFKSALATDGDYGQEEITPADTSGFEVGIGVTIADNNSGGFHTTVATIIARDGDNFIINKPLNADCMVARGAYVQNTFPVISGYYVENVTVQNILIDGNKDKNEHLNGCRGAGIFLYRAKNTLIKACIVQDYNGDGISFQQSNDIVAEHCTSRNNTSLGFHPGSGSQRPIIRSCSSYNNGSDGLFLCWRVKNGLFEENQIFNNGQFGISIGHKDTDNIFRKNVIFDNKSHGVFFRNEPEYTGGHRNLLENNVIINNGKDGEGCGIYINGETYDITIVNNDISDKRLESEKTQQYGIWIGAKAKRIKIRENLIEGNKLGAIKNDSNDAEIEIYIK